MTYNPMTYSKSSGKGAGIKGAEPIVSRIVSGKTISPAVPSQAPTSLFKGSKANGGVSPTSRVYNEVK